MCVDCTIETFPSGGVHTSVYFSLRHVNGERTLLSNRINPFSELRKMGRGFKSLAFADQLFVGALDDEHCTPL